MARPREGTLMTDPDTAVQVSDVLDRAGYTEPRILQLLELSAWPPFRQRLEALPLYLWRTREGTALDVASRIHHLCSQLRHERKVTSSPSAAATEILMTTSLSDRQLGHDIGNHPRN